MKWSVEYRSLWDLRRKLFAYLTAFDVALGMVEEFEPAFVLYREDGVVFGHSRHSRPSHVS